MRNQKTLTGNLTALSVVLLSILAAGCGSNKTGQVIPNDKPFVKITGGPLEGSRQSYTARVYWSGWDYDGIVDHYEYAIDPPSVFTEAEVARPDSFPDINLQIIPGPTEKEDTLVVSKVVDGTTYSFLWIKTPLFSRSFAFNTDVPDSITDGSVLKPAGEFHGVHRIYVRCEDDDGAYSDLTSDSKLAYTASTLCPTSEITKPIIPDREDGFLNVGPTVTIAWDGTDADSPDPKKKPTGYLYKLLNLDLLDPKPLFLSAPAGILYQRPQPNSTDEGDPAWHYQSADTLKKTFFLVPGNQYVFGVRAKDVANAVEPFLNFARNVFRFQSLPDAGTPELTVCEPSLGCFTFEGTGQRPEEVQVPVGGRLRFSWSADAEAYGGTIDGFSWGLDIPDLSLDGPGSGWSGWGKSENIPAPIIFNVPSTHVFYVRVRDSSGTISIGSIILHIVDFALDRDVLFVDDFKNDSSSYSRSDDATTDAFYKQLFDDSGRFPATSSVDSLWTYNAGGPNDVGNLPPLPPELDFLGRFRLIVWYANLGYGGQSALFQVTSYKNRHLGAYLSAGGKLWVIGEQTCAAMMRGQTSAPNSYPLTPTAGDFAYDYMKLASNRIENALAGQRQGQDKTSPTDNMIGAAPFWSPDDENENPHHPSFPPAEQDSTRWNPFRKAMAFGDAVFDPIYAQDIPGFPATGHIDSLYIYKAVKSNSKYNNRLNAIRFSDDNPDRSQGRTQWFGFDLFWIKKDQAQEIFNRTIDWFNEETLSGNP
jgi:hypothetical protein